MQNSMFNPLPANHDGCYFAIAMANWAMNYSDKRRPLDHWWVVRVVIKQPAETRVNHISIRTPPPIQYPREFMSTDPRISGRYRHPTGRLWLAEETYSVVNELNNRDLTVLAATITLGGVGQLVRRVACEILNLDPKTGEEL